jgi:hypothetical protein
MSTLQNFGVPTGIGQGRGGILQPKTKSKFRVIVTNFGIPNSSIALTQQVESVNRPTITQEPVEVNSYMSRAYFGGKPSFSTISLSVRDDVTNSVSALVGAQIQKQMNHFLQTTPLAGANYKFQMLIDTLDGGGTSQADAAVLEEWALEGCFISEVNYEQFDYKSSESMMIELTIRYDNATQGGGLMPLNPILDNPGDGFLG